MDPKVSVLRVRMDMVLNHLPKPSFTISVSSSILNVATFQDAAPVSSKWRFAKDVHINILYAFLFSSAELTSPVVSSLIAPLEIIVCGPRPEIQIRLLAVVILVFNEMRLITVISYCSVQFCYVAI